jgi:putative PIN family toxin of toxin-antitoxin system
MIRAVLDANVIVSAVLTTAGIPAQILDAWRTERFALLVSAPILEEVARVLEYPRLARLHHWPQAKIRDFVAELAYLGIMTPGEITLNVVRNDPADNRYLECAVEGAADYLVSGDQDLLDLHEHSGIRIVSSSTFLEALRSHRRPASQED